MVDLVYITECPGLDPDFFLNWLTNVAEHEGKILGDICVVVGDDEWLREHNVKFLNHDYYTDIITFDYSTNDLVSGDLLISVDRVIDNATKENVSRETELNRVVVHGLLHLCGYGDKSDEESIVMRQKEDFYLSLL